MKEDRLRELEEWLRGIIKYAEGHFNHGSDHKAGKIGLDLITYVRQLEKEKEELDEKYNGLSDNTCDAADDYFKIKEANAELLSLITTDEIDNSTLVECLRAVRLIIIDGHFERSEELCAWVEKIAVLSPTKKLEEK